jgi:hypothetical protein
MPDHDLAHLRVDNFKISRDYSPPRRDMSGNSSGRNRNVHGPKLQAELLVAFAAARTAQVTRHPEARADSAGVYLQVESQPGEALPDLDWSSKHIRLGAVRVNEEGSQVGALYVPVSAETFLISKVVEYSEQDTGKERPRHEDKFAPLEVIRPGTLGSLWTDKRLMTADPMERFWWECWCVKELAQDLARIANGLRLRTSDRRLYFPESEVIPVYANRNEMSALIHNTDAIEELRRATDTPSFFTTAARREQNKWVDDLVPRVDSPSATAPAVCILDNGIAAAHPLVATALAATDCYTLNPAWGVDDHDAGGHGTNMAGAALYGDLTFPLADQRRIALEIRLESVKFIPPPGFPTTDPDTYGVLTQSAVSAAEIQNPYRQRVICMAVTNLDVSGERPTSWSSAIDQCCAGVMIGDEADENGEPPRRLMFVAAGNVPDHSNPDDASDLEEFPIEDPAQAWNAVCVGGFTDKIDITPEEGLDGWHAIAPAGDHSPYSRISADWPHSLSPMKPEVVFEAGNRAASENDLEVVAGVDSLSLLTTGKDFLTEPLVSFWATSPATAQAAGMAAQIMARHPHFWPETVRALMVHGAEWTPAMRRRLEACGSKADCVTLARHFGYGVPRLDRALASAQNDLALIAQAHIAPYKRMRKPNAEGHLVLEGPTFNEIHYYELPWPTQALERFDGRVRLKVTLSYFIEPSPGRTAPVTPSLYQSFGLRFDLKRKRETQDAFRKRVNRLERGKEKRTSADPDSGWMFGTKSVAAGSLHCDVWEGPAIDLAARNGVAVYPVGGWWRYRPHLNRHDSRARYALIISISAVDDEIDLYSEVQSKIAIAIDTPIST